MKATKARALERSFVAIYQGSQKNHFVIVMDRGRDKSKGNLQYSNPLSLTITWERKI